jgi:hypothetical protein
MSFSLWPVIAKQHSTKKPGSPNFEEPGECFALQSTDALGAQVALLQSLVLPAVKPT